jgi:hypothetical protein
MMPALGFAAAPLLRLYGVFLRLFSVFLYVSCDASSLTPFL